jgi:phosphoglycolate phosphatase
MSDSSRDALSMESTPSLMKPVPIQRLTSTPIEAMVLDLDGTLVDSIHDTTAALNIVLQQAGRLTLNADQVWPLIGDGAPFMISAAFDLTGVRLSPDELQTIHRAYLDYYIQNPDRYSRLYDGVNDTLDVLRSQGIKLGICSNKSIEVVLRILARFDLEKYFCGVTGGDSFEYSKPDGRHVLKTLDLMRADATQAVMVGDSEKDIDAARDVGMPIIAVTYGYVKNPASLWRADAVIEAFADVVGLVTNPSDINAVGFSSQTG